MRTPNIHRIVAACLFIAAALLSIVASWHFALLGYDELDRNIIEVILLSTIFSLVQSIGITMLVMALPLTAGYAIARKRWRTLNSVLLAFAGAIESVPLLMWLLILAAVGGPELRAVAWIGLAIGVFPYVTTIWAECLTGTFEAPYMEAAEKLGLPWYRLLGMYIVPNVWPVIFPPFIQILGILLTFEAALGALGMATRAELRLGALILRGREAFALSPALLLSSLVALCGIYLVINAIGRRAVEV